MSNIKSINVNGTVCEIDSNISTELSLIDYTKGDFSISDNEGNMIVNFKDGHIQTKEFDSSDIQTSSTIHYNSFSIIGDSYSTFSGYTNPTTNAQWYPDTTTSNNDVRNLEQTWWYKFANEYQSVLILNDSYSGSTICYDGYSAGHDSAAAGSSFCKRIERMTQPCELLFIFGATNDSWAKSEIGDYKYTDWTEDDKSYFRPALAYLIDYIQKHHIGTKIVFILNDSLSNDINTSVSTICEHYNVDVIKLTAISKTGGHPNINGMEEIKNQLIKYLNS